MTLSTINFLPQAITPSSIKGKNKDKKDIKIQSSKIPPIETLAATENT